MAQMANGADYISGTFTVPASGTEYVLNFGKTFSSYLVIVEMTDTSKSQLSQLGINGNRTYMVLGVYPKRTISNNDLSVAMAWYRVNCVSFANSVNDTDQVTMTGSSITFLVNDTNYANRLYNGYSYNYYIVEIK